MIHEITLDGKIVRYKVVEKPVKYVTLRFLEDGTLLVVTPSKEIVREVLIKKRNWILSKLSIIEEAKELAGEGFPLFGRFYSLEIGEKFEIDDKNRIIIYPGIDVLRDWIKKEVKRRAQEISKEFGVAPKRIYVRVMKTKWGSTTWRKSVTLNLSSVALPEELFHYLVIHELAHLIELNHSKRFWSIVARYHPDYKEKRRELKKWWFIVHLNETWRAILQWPGGGSSSSWA
ncbi:M48 family metallopeptidase [Pyrococcus horikoshii]|uniref:YgjP-like metallopeptidase domain-containing protein n=2 Tax=Pyrococcus horikoshii TaxID=53953 RepID=O58443_PYRHO|nr:M48 family metallopeptidase [Pyrococcus horikoshii]BAA29803.1 230aa long hypothetical protein [Pyrococcus horikoshii OT3]HII61368.1 M48 family metallopeptidase [Pyrococcus horikoshii]